MLVEHPPALGFGRRLAKNTRKIYRSSGGPDMPSLLLSLEEQIPVSRKDLLLAAGFTGTDLPSPSPIWLAPKVAAFPTPMLHCCTTLPATGWATAAPRECRGSTGPSSPLVESSPAHSGVDQSLPTMGVWPHCGRAVGVTSPAVGSQSGSWI